MNYTLTRPAAHRWMLLLIAVLSVSYWYCLPVLTQSVLGYNEFRAYDFLLLLLIGGLLAKHRQRLRRFLRRDMPGKWAFRFCLWATATFPVTFAISVADQKLIWSLVTAVFLFHLWGFVLAYAAFRMFIKTRSQCLMLLDLFLLVGLIEAFVICLQGVGFLPTFWSELYESYGPRTFSATLGPNRTLPGHVMILVLVAASAYWRNAGAVQWKRLVLASCAAVTALVALGLSGSRTAWAAFAVFCLVSLFGQKLRVGAIAFIIVISIGVIVMVPRSVEDQIGDTYKWRITSGLSKVNEDSSALTKFQAVDSGRYKHWSDGLKVLVERPWLIPFGGGFNNYTQVSDGPSAHNVYITLITEVGVIGLFFYLMWLKNIWSESSVLMRLGRRQKKYDSSAFLPYEIKPLIASLLVSLAAGEILYPYRPCFAFMGMFLFLCAVMNHRAMTQPETRPQSVPVRRRPVLIGPSATNGYALKMKRQVRARLPRRT